MQSVSNIRNISTHSLTKRLTHLWKEATAGKYISTHSLTKRLTTLMMDFFFSHSHFNSQPHEEADGRPGWLSAYPLIFQLTASRRGWLPEEFSLPLVEVFQLTASRRGWPAFLNDLISYHIISTHSLTKRLTETGNTRLKRGDISTHSLTKRLTTTLL